MGDDDGVDDEDDVGDELMILAWMCTSSSKQQCVKGVEKILDRFEGLPPIIILVIICRAPSVGFVASVLECYRNVVTIELWGGIKADAMLSSGHFKSFQRCSWGRLWKWKINKFSQYLDRPHIYEKESLSLMAKWLGIKFSVKFCQAPRCYPSFSQLWKDSQLSNCSQGSI